MYQIKHLSTDVRLIRLLILALEEGRTRRARRLAMRVRHHALREAWLEEIAEVSASAMQCAA
tara:strand:+ start:342 stop:527 length:186 start_codon:yes stop_codon:yes gene_type:complete